MTNGPALTMRSARVLGFPLFAVVKLESLEVCCQAGRQIQCGLICKAELMTKSL